MRFNDRNITKRNIVSDINITPLVDVMLVLLVIFMVTSPMMLSSIKVDLPETNSQSSSEKEEPLTISIDEKGVIYIQEQMVKEEALVAKLQAITAEKYDTRIFIKGDKKLNYGRLVDLVSNINEAGFNKVALVTNVKPSMVTPKKS